MIFLPKDLLIEIVIFLEETDWKNLYLSCRFFRELFEDHPEIYYDWEPSVGTFFQKKIRYTKTADIFSDLELFTTIPHSFRVLSKLKVDLKKFVACYQNYSYLQQHLWTRFLTDSPYDPAKLVFLDISSSGFIQFDIPENFLDFYPKLKYLSLNIISIEKLIIKSPVLVGLFTYGDNVEIKECPNLIALGININSWECKTKDVMEKIPSNPLPKLRIFYIESWKFSPLWLTETCLKNLEISLESLTELWFLGKKKNDPCFLSSFFPFLPKCRRDIIEELTKAQTLHIPALFSGHMSMRSYCCRLGMAKLTINKIFYGYI